MKKKQKEPKAGTGAFGRRAAARLAKLQGRLGERISTEKSQGMTRRQHPHARDGK